VEECLAEVKACAGDNQLGGDDFDEVIFNLAREQIRKHIGNVQLDAFQGQILTEVARQAKIQLEQCVGNNPAPSRIHTDLKYYERPQFAARSTNIRNRG